MHIVQKETCGEVNISLWSKEAFHSSATDISDVERARLAIAAHVKFAMNEAFVKRNHSHLILLEDDLEVRALFILVIRLIVRATQVSEDFLHYFESTAWLIDHDPSLWCISAWNDNGFLVNTAGSRVRKQAIRRLLRTGYFPGLGWMIKRSTWMTLRQIWPANPLTGWDMWLHVQTNFTWNHECIYPEV